MPVVVDRGGRVQRLRSVQVLRALAACAVVFLHAFPDVRGPVGNAGFGAAGVDLFFVISGFIMASVSKGRTAGQFLRDRLWRIYPLWWIAVLPWLFFLPRGPAFIASSLTLWPIYGGSYFPPHLLVGWTLSFELLFYGGVTLALATRSAVPLIFYALCLAGALTTSNALLISSAARWRSSSCSASSSHICRDGRRSACSFRSRSPCLRRRHPKPGPIAVALDPQSAIWRVAEWGLPAALILWGALSLELLFEHRMFNLPVKIGDASYSIYLFHPLIAYGIALTWPARLALAVGVRMGGAPAGGTPDHGAAVAPLSRIAQKFQWSS